MEQPNPTYLAEEPPLFLEEGAHLHPELLAKYTRLLNHLSSLPGAVTAFSGGVDSSLVAYLAHRLLGSAALAVTADSPSLKRADLELAARLAADWGMAHQVVATDELNFPEYRANPANRCYYCKANLYRALAAMAFKLGHGVVLNGANADDKSDHRPGERAAAELKVQSPLAALDFSKSEIRAVAAALGLANADKPQSACLSSRVPYGTPISQGVLAQIERAEAHLAAMGFENVRVRHHGPVARLEVGVEELHRLLEERLRVVEGVKGAGYTYVALDLEGFRSGSMNELL